MAFNQDIGGYMKNFILLISLVQFVSCGKNQDNENNSQWNSLSTQENIQISMDEGPLKFVKKINRVKNLDQNSILSHEHLFNEYIIQADFKSPAFSGEKLICEKSRNRLGKVEILEEAFEVGASRLNMAFNLTDDDPLEVVVQCRVEDLNDRVVFMNKPKKIYKDIIIENQLYISELRPDLNDSIKLGIILIKDESTLLIKDQKISLVAERFFSLGGQVKSFSEEDQKAPKGQNGNDGGELRIITEEMEGDLTVDLSGQDGGSYIPSYPSGKRAQKGSPADILGRGVRGSRARKCRDIALASSRATNGHDGVDGAKGQSGGDMGVFVFTSKNESKIQIHFVSEPGNGSSGQVGQLGGKPGGFLPSVARTSLKEFDEHVRSIKAHQCRVKPDYQANPGSYGRNGNDGKPGLIGKRKLSVFKNGNHLEVFQ